MIIKNIILLIFTLTIATSVHSQIQPINVADLTIKIGVNGEKELFYGFAKGDKILFNFEELKGKSLKEIEIIELPTNSLFMDFKTTKIESKTINVNKAGIYQFKFKNSALSGRICKINIQRIPKDEGSVEFNTNWEWKTVYDTTYTTYTEDSLIGYDTLKYKETIKELIKTEKVDEMISDKTQRVHSFWNENSSYSYLRVNIPQNKTEPYREEKVIAWAYWIGVGKEASEAYSQNVKSIGKLASGIASVYGTPLAGIAVGSVTELLTPKTGDDIQYSFIYNYENLKAYMAGQAYYQFDKGKGIAAYGKNSNLLEGSFYIGLHNDNQTRGLDVNVKIVIIKEIKTYKDIEYNREKITPKYLKLNKIKTIITSRKIRVNSK